MKYIDNHCHIDLVLQKMSGRDYADLKTEFPDSFEALIQVCCHPETIDWALEFISQNNEAYGAFGVHPHDAHLYTDEVHDNLLRALAHPKAVAWGEIGLDYFYDQSPRDIQREVLARQLQGAKACALPIVLHTRSADEDTLAVLREHYDPQLAMHVHCFTGGPEFAQALMDLGPNVYLGYTGIITFKNADNVRESLQVTPLDRLLLETDAPFLAPVPYRGKTAHPGMIPEIAEKIAAEKSVEIAQVWRSCRENTRKVYGI